MQAARVVLQTTTDSSRDGKQLNVMTLPDAALFLYGTMLDREILELVLGRSIASSDLISARLAGVRRLKVPDESYPVLVESPDDEIEGAVLPKPGPTDWDRIAFFENVEYEHRPCQVELDDGTRMIAVFYSEGSMVAGASETWTLDWWQTTHKPRLLPIIRDYMALFGDVSLEEADNVWERLTGGNRS